MICHVFLEGEFPSFKEYAADFNASKFIGHRFFITENNDEFSAILVSLKEGEFRHLPVLNEIFFKNTYYILNAQAFDLAQKVAAYYLAPLPQVLSLCLPPVIKKISSFSKIETVRSGLSPLVLNAKQNEIMQKILSEDMAIFPEHIIWGVTGSGKTRIYESLIENALQKNTQTLLLVPEIALSGQIMRSISERFSEYTVLYHSALSGKERVNAHRRFLEGDAKIAIGTRSAIFLPAENLAQIIIDEEHDASFKDQRKIRFDARTVARLRLNANTKLILASATPSLETLSRAKTQKARLYRIRERATGQSMPDIFIPEYKTQFGLISPFLAHKMHEHLEKGNQVLLLMNRRGHSTHVHCPVCDSYAECPRCAIFLTYHKDGYLRCHYCGFHEVYQKHCPKDGAVRMLTGRGIQRVEEILEAQFSNYQYARLDRDTARTKGFTEDVLSAMREKKIQILIGTQMIAKGFDIEGITLVGVLSIDQLFTAPDFRSSELAWQLLAQVVGRSGRHKQGEVVIQTTMPKHPVIQAIKSHDDDAFYAHEAHVRQLTKYPPFVFLARILLLGNDEAELLREAEKLLPVIQPINTTGLFDSAAEKISLLGPAFPSLHKIDNDFRVHFLIKAETIPALSTYLARIQPFLNRLEKTSRVRVVMDIDPRETM